MKRQLMAKVKRACGHEEQLAPPANLVTREALTRWATMRSTEPCTACRHRRLDSVVTGAVARSEDRP